VAGVSLPSAYAFRVAGNHPCDGFNSPGSGPNRRPDGHDERMAGRGGSEQAQRSSSAAAAWTVVPQDRYDANPLVLLGNPSLDEVRLTSRPESASTARRLTLAVLRLWALPQLGEDCELLVSELVGNAVRHTGARTFGLRMLRRRGWIRVEVRDPSRALPCLLPVRELDTSGRGLFLVDKLSDRWGVDLLPRGKTTWFEKRVVER
jgi:anti-sigma regulatory factor (Ser/Thr protein kinase)